MICEPVTSYKVVMEAQVRDRIAFGLRHRKP